MGLLKFIQKLEPNKEKSPFMHTVYDGLYTFFYVPDHVTGSGTHIKDGMDLKRTMVFVVLALQICYIFGTWNIGHQHFLAIGQYGDSFFDAWHLKVAYGLVKILPMFIISHLVGLGVEFYYAAKKGHPIEEGFLVSAALIPLIMPPDLPIWILCLAIVFAVILGKEAFGGTGMNIMNIALLTRVFVFFAYPSDISGDSVWVSGLASNDAGSSVIYSWWHTGFFNGLFDMLGWAKFDAAATVVDGFTGATPLGLGAAGGMKAISDHYTESQMFWGFIPGSVGETFKPGIIAGALFLIATGIASWRIMLSMLLGTIAMGLLLNGVAPSVDSFAAVPWHTQLVMGGFLFAMVFMATDPVTAASTNKGKWIYGALIGIVGMIIRVLNPAYPEGWMLAILFLNVFAPLIDHYIIKSNIKKRLNRV